MSDRHERTIGVESSDDDHDLTEKMPDWGIRAGPRRKIWFDPSKVCDLVLEVQQKCGLFDTCCCFS